jgi:hypothetical protein
VGTLEKVSSTMKRTGVLAGLLLFAIGCGSGQPSPEQAESVVTAQTPPDAEQPTQQAQKNTTGLWLSRSTAKDDETVVLSIALPSEPEGRAGKLFDQTFARAVIGRKLERGERVFAHDFSVEFLPTDSEQGTDGSGRGFWIIREKNGKNYKLGYYDRQKVSARDKRSSIPVMRWKSIDETFCTPAIGRSLKRGERAFLHDPKVDAGS